jgi:uncharacterized repeat protein (TIGR03803 family)
VKAFIFFIAVLGAVMFALVVTPSTWAADTLTILYSFQGGSDGAEPWSGLISDAAGNLYGTAAGWGAGTNGVVFELSRTSSGAWSETVLYSFAGGSDGSNPVGIVFDGKGNLFGLTRLGGDSLCACGTIFELSPNSGGGWTEQVLYRFSVSTPSSPLNSPTLDSAGNLFVVTPNGGAGGRGAVFELSPNVNGGWTGRTIYSFSKTSGLPSWGPVTLDSAGNLYGTTQNEGGPDGGGKGTVYKLSKTAWGWNFTLLYTFRGPRGAYPVGTVVFDSVGNLYGTTSEGGATNHGTAFELSPTTQGQWKETLLHDFTGGRDGAIPWAGPTVDSAGNVYGVTTGSATAPSTVFMLSPSPLGGWKFQVLADLPATNGYFGFAPLLNDAAGNLYGVSLGAGNSKCEGGCGFVYELAPSL